MSPPQKWPWHSDSSQSHVKQNWKLNFWFSTSTFYHYYGENWSAEHDLSTLYTHIAYICPLSLNGVVLPIPNSGQEFLTTTSTYWIYTPKNERLDPKMMVSKRNLRDSRVLFSGAMFIFGVFFTLRTHVSFFWRGKFSPCDHSPSSGWWFQPIWKISIKLDHSPNGNKNKTCFKPNSPNKPKHLFQPTCFKPNSPDIFSD